MKIAIAHYCEGGGHGPRMLAVGKALEDRGHEICIAGGGPGAKFVEINGYEEFKPEKVDFIEDYEKGLHMTFMNSTPKSVKRVRDYISWLKREEPDVVVTDDMFAGLACVLMRKKFYFIGHDTSDIYSDYTASLGTWGWNKFFDKFAEDFFQPAVWEDPKYSGVGPMALEIEKDVRQDIEALLIPSAYSESIEEIEEKLKDTGRDVTVVGGKDWELQESLQPFIDEADLVVCSGYSAVMEASVAGTPCIILPETAEQKGVTELIDRKGFRKASNPEEVIELADEIEEPEKQENGAEQIAEKITEAEDGK